MSKKDSFPCFCGSNKPFKSCCKSKINTPKKVIDETKLNNPKYINNFLKKMLDDTDFKICFHPNKEECKKPIKNAHTLQNKGVLSKLAVNNNVVIFDILNKTINGSSLKTVRKSNATTFYGFCEYHDSKLFSDIENIKYSNQAKQNFLYAYRCCSQEYHKKVRLIKSIQKAFKLNPSIYNIAYFEDLYKLQMLAYKDVEEYMNIFNESLLKENYDVLVNYVYEFDKSYDFAVTTMFSPTVDINGNVLNNIYSKSEERLKSVFATFIPTDCKSYFILSCLKSDFESLKSYFDAIKNFNEEELMLFLNNLFPTYSENIVLSPRLIDSWTPYSRREFENIILGGIGDFSKLLSFENPFSNVEKFFKGMAISNGVNSMKERQPYNLFKIV